MQTLGAMESLNAQNCMPLKNCINSPTHTESIQCLRSTQYATEVCPMHLHGLQYFCPNMVGYLKWPVDLSYNKLFIDATVHRSL